MYRATTTGIFWVSVLLCAGTPLASRAQVYRCTAADGSVAYQDHPCARGQQQKMMDVSSRPPPGYLPPSAATVAPPATVASALPAPTYVQPPAPLPLMYACMGAVNGKHYLTRHPPPPYLAPLGVMGYPPQSLSQAYGSHPEAARPRIGGSPLAAGMTEVEDFCTPATRAEVCRFVQREYADNARKLRLAMRHEQPPLEQREQELEDQLRNCR